LLLPASIGEPPKPPENGAVTLLVRLSRYFPVKSELIRTVVTTARMANIRVERYVPSRVRRELCQTGRPTRHSIARAVAERFPWLAPDYRKEAAKSWWEKPYWLTIFDAIAVGLVCQHELDRRRQRNAA